MGKHLYNRKDNLQSVKNVLNILRSFTIDEPEKGVRELSESLGMSKSVVQRYMATLASEGFLEQDPFTRKYRLGIPFMILSTIVTSHFDAFKEFHPTYKALADKLGETVRCSTLEGTEVVQVYAFRCKHRCRSFNKIGKLNPAYCTSAGKVLLAYSDNEELIERVIQKGLKRFTKNTKTDPAEFREDLQMVREQGHSICIEEFGVGGISIAAPIRDHSGKFNFAIEVTSTTKRLNSMEIQTFVNEIKKASMEVSKLCQEYQYQRRW
ncbi:IclR family transcriptional regulator [Alteribacillus sp. JSM 102045]|uniref:IclR family transcriptional regulator n=1 Tax=Alteribacillus sp. JSM 102045 TaxID=1562101 RepID=UPI0035BF50EC